MEGIAGHIIRRLLFLPITLLVVSFATFYITRWGPGDPVRIYAGSGYADPEALDRVRHTYGLDKPIHEQYGIYMRRLLLHGDLGPSFRYRDRSIPEIIRPKIWVSIRLASYSFVIVYLVGIPVGIYAAMRQGTWRDPLLIGSFLVFDSIPVLVLVPTLVVVFAAQLHWLPAGGFDGMFSKSMIIPTIALSIGGIAGIARLARTATLSVLHDDFVRTARAKGLQEHVVIIRHVVRNAVVPIMTTVIGLSLVGLISGALFTETILGIPGIGSFIYESVTNKDYNVILAVVLMLSTAFVLANLFVDIALIVIDPRIRAAGGRSR
jgi:ABC-type dipeptide/oligopeptide/nickel transport system permease component